MKNPFDNAEIIHSYSRKQAIEDGVLVDLSSGAFEKLAKEAGFRFPVACTSRSFQACMEMTKASTRAGCSLEGRVWDVLYMLKLQLRGVKGPICHFQVMAVTRSVRPFLVRLKAVCGPGDNLEPVITIMMEDED